MSSEKEHPERLALRAAPQPVTRISRRAIVVVSALTSAALLGATLWSLQPLRRTPADAPTELHNIERVQRPEALSQLPPDYSKLAPVAEKVAAPPPLGAPLPGDLGGPMLRAQQAPPVDVFMGSAPQHLPPAVDAAEIERTAKAREADEAARSGLFFRRTSDGAREPRPPSEALPAASTPSEDRTAAAAGNAKIVDARRRFLDDETAAPTTSKHRVVTPTSPYVVTAGTIIPAALVTGIQSDLPGQVIAQTTEPVFDTATGRHLLIPQGSRLIGQYDSNVAYGQRRVLLVWTRMIFPDASSIELDRLPGADTGGYAGLEDEVDWKWKRLLAGAAVSTLIGVTAELAHRSDGGAGNVSDALRRALQDTTNQAGQEITRRNLSVQPTLTIRPGFPVRVLLKSDLNLTPYGRDAASSLSTAADDTSAIR